ncbi:hypothetical protein B0T10DRAFT_548075 [Thelonectria olida]|uniref:Uncharacterized protein n=1 Tax=Thelonectria olida TaxID=1576542 RepID=A0A9P8W585_9HYPO|nr:hypothetical protein B0T10DRAFT_548075 [Thelonectria olida]
MKFSLIFPVVALLNAAVSAVSLPHDARAVVVDRQDDKRRYRLKIKSKIKQINNKYLSDDHNQMGIFNNGTKETSMIITKNAVGDKVYAEVFTLNPWPLTVVEHALGLVGTNGFLEFRTLEQPTTKDIGTNETYSWQDFSIKKEKKKLNELFYGDAKPGWVASPIGNWSWKIKHYDGNQTIIQTYIPIQIYLEDVKSNE